MSRTWSLAQLMALFYSPPRMVQLAADTGCDGAGVRLLPITPGGVAYPLMDDAAMLRETFARIAYTGVKIFDLELIRIDEDFDASRYGRFFEVGQRLGARHVTVLGFDPVESRLTASFAALCDAAAPYGLTCDLEFMVWTAVRDVKAAARILRAAARPNGGILVDALHVARSGDTPAAIGALDPSWLHFAQICDGPVPGPATTEGLIHAARCERMLPGEGDLDLRALFDRLPEGIVTSIEVPSDSRAPAMGYEAWAAKAFADAKRILE